MKEQRLKELEEAHKETMRLLAADYDNFVDVEKEKLVTYGEQVEAQRAKLEEAMAKLNKEMKENHRVRKQARLRHSSTGPSHPPQPHRSRQ